jgi:hypothetical protein
LLVLRERVSRKNQKTPHAEDVRLDIHVDH